MTQEGKESLNAKAESAAQTPRFLSAIAWKGDRAIFGDAALVVVRWKLVAFHGCESHHHHTEFLVSAAAAAAAQL